MRAAVFTETGGPLSIENLEPSPPGPRDVVVQLGASGVCHSDLSLMHGYVGIMPGTVLGHEGAGTVLEVGKDVTKVKPGDRIVASFVPACGECWFCLHDESHLCDIEFERHDGDRAASAPTAASTSAHDRPRHVRRGDDVQRAARS